MDKITVERDDWHDFTEGRWGHSILDVNVSGPVVKITGIGYGIRAGHYLLLRSKTGFPLVRASTVKYENNPDDMFDLAGELVKYIGGDVRKGVLIFQSELEAT